jgi:Fe-S cluster assembly protein SufB
MSSQVETLVNREYKYGFVSDIAADTVPRGLTEETIRLISAKKQEPDFLLQWRLKAYRRWLEMTEPHWSNVRYAPIDYQNIIYSARSRPSRGRRWTRWLRSSSAPTRSWASP